METCGSLLKMAGEPVAFLIHRKRLRLPEINDLLPELPKKEDLSPDIPGNTDQRFGFVVTGAGRYSSLNSSSENSG